MTLVDSFKNTKPIIYSLSELNCTITIFTDNGYGFYVDFPYGNKYIKVDCYTEGFGDEAHPLYFIFVRRRSSNHSHSMNDKQISCKESRLEDLQNDLITLINVINDSEPEYRVTLTQSEINDILSSNIKNKKLKIKLSELLDDYKS